MREVYLDYASATPLDPRVKRAMAPFWDDVFGNPSSLHQKGREAKKAIDEARISVAAILHCRAGEIIFTAGATEADNIAIFGQVRALGGRKSNFVTSSIEHHAVLKSFEALEREGHTVTCLRVNSEGLIDPRALEKSLSPDTALVSIGYANNEIGTVQLIAEIGKVVKKFRESKRKLETGSEKLEASEKAPLFHCDASQAAGFLDLNVDRLGVDLLTLNSAKIYGPKGMGALFVRRNVELAPVIHGGGQEKNLRSGTENVPGIVGLAQALEIAEKEKNKESARLTELRDCFLARLLREIPGAALNGSPDDRLPNNVNIAIPGIDGEAAVIYLDAEGVYAATGSACASESVDPSHVLLAIGRSREEALGSIRFTLGRGTNREDLDYALDSLLEILPLIRRHDPANVKSKVRRSNLRNSWSGVGG